MIMSSVVSNRLLAALSPEASEAITSRCKAVSLPIRTQLYEPEQTPKHAYFLTSGFASVVAPMLDGGTAEVESIGREGVVGSFHLLGNAPVPTGCFMQLAGTGLRMELSELRELFGAVDEVRTRILELVQQQALTVSQLSGCNRLHEAEARLSRWLLMAQDRAKSDVLKLTQEFLAEMLGTQRTTVSIIAGALQRADLIRYRHGEVRIVDREGLKSAACDCYRIVHKLHSNLYALPWDQDAKRGKSAGRNLKRD
jgi:CRP-like cAMP-binding protein